MGGTYRPPMDQTILISQLMQRFQLAEAEEPRCREPLLEQAGGRLA